jgi:hypothetical protein
MTQKNVREATMTREQEYRQLANSAFSQAAEEESAQLMAFEGALVVVWCVRLNPRKPHRWQMSAYDPKRT